MMNKVSDFGRRVPQLSVAYISPASQGKSEAMRYFAQKPQRSASVMRSNRSLPLDRGIGSNHLIENQRIELFPKARKGVLCLDCFWHG